MSGRLIVVLLGGLIAVFGIGAAVFLMDQTPAPDVAPAESATASTPEPAAPPPPAPAPEPRSTPAPARPAESEPAPAPIEVAPTTGSLRVESDVPETSVFVNREFLGEAPVTKADLPPGTHTVVLSPTGYDMVSREVEIVAGEEAELSWDFKTIRLDVAIPVVHKHAFGSCQGTLRGSPQGVTYETTNEDDGFVVAFADLETFEIDYLEANLRVKIRDGKTYNFSNEDEDAEPLFGFHRDVDKVRLRVLGGGMAPGR